MTAGPDTSAEGELALLRQLVRGQVHSLNNLLMTLDFALGSLDASEDREELQALSKEIGQELRSLRRAAALPGLARRPGELSVSSAMDTARALAANVRHGIPRITGGLDDTRELEPARVWLFTRLFTALLVALDARQCQSVTVAAGSPPGELAIFELALAVESPPFKPSFALAVELAEQLGGALVCDRGERLLRIRVLCDAQPSEASLAVDENEAKSAVGEAPRAWLVVDDDRSLEAYFTLLFRAAGCRAAFARNASEALRVFEAEPVEAALIDLQLAGEDGLDLGAELRQRRSIPVIIMSGDELEEADQQRRERIGALGPLIKPFAMDALLELVSAGDVTP